MVREYVNGKSKNLRARMADGCDFNSIYIHVNIMCGERERELMMVGIQHIVLVLGTRIRRTRERENSFNHIAGANEPQSINAGTVVVPVASQKAETRGWF